MALNSENLVHVLSKPKMQNQLLANYLSEELGLECNFLPVNHFASLCKNFTDEKCLVLCDCRDSKPANMWQCLDKASKYHTCEGIIVLFNVKPEAGIEYDALTRKVRGVFYKNDSLETLTKGIKFVLNGELWFSRQVLAKGFIQITDSATPYGKPAPRLTPREKEILNLIKASANNKEIASKLCISPHTVKTHLGKIYKKIDVHNRTQAALWAVENL